MSKKTVFRIVMLIAISVASFFAYQSWQQIASVSDTDRDIDDLGNLWSCKEEIAAAKDKLTNAPQEALVITTDISQQPQVALVFDGLPSRTMTAKIVDLLTKYNAKAAFFVEGQNAADNIEIMKLLNESGQSIGNYTFVGISHAEKLPVDSLLGELCRTQKAINVQTAKTPAMFRAPNTNYTPELLKAVNAAGIEAAVKSNITVNMGAINTQADAQKFVASVPVGSILAVTLGTPVDIPAQEAGKTDERPAIDKKPTIVDPENTQENVVTKVDTVQKLEWLIAAFQQRGIKLADVSTFRKIKFVPANSATGR